MLSTVKQHAQAGLVAAAVIAAAFSHGLFDASGYAAASIAVWALVIAGLAGRALSVGTIGGLAVAAGCCLAGIAVLSFLSVGWASDQGRAFEEAVRVSFYLGLFVLAACTADRARRGEWLAGLTVGLAVVSVLALLAYLQPGTLDGGGSDVPGAAGRLSYPVGYWNGAAALMATATVLLAYAAARAGSRRLRVTATAVIPLVVLGMWLTGSRGGAAALLIALAILLATSSDRSGQVVPIAIGLGGAAVLAVASQQMDALTSGVADSANRADGDRMSAICIAVVAVTAAVSVWLGDSRPAVRLSRRTGLALAALGILAVVVAVAIVDPANRFREFQAAPPAQGGVAVGGEDLSSNGRWQFWGSAIDAFASEPLRGIGAGGFENWWGGHGDLHLFVRNPHSLPLQEAAELGIPGIVLFAGFCLAVGIACVRRVRTGIENDSGVMLAVAACAATGALFDWTWEIPAVFGPAVICAGLILSVAPATERAPNRRLLTAGTAVTAALAIVAGGLVVLSEQELRQSRELAGDNRLDAAVDRAKTARSIVPWSSDPYTQLALLENDRGDFSEGLAYIRQAEERDSEDWRLPLIEATLQQKAGDLDAARAASARAQSLSPLPIVSIVFPPEPAR